MESDVDKEIEADQLSEKFDSLEEGLKIPLAARECQR